MVRDGLDGDWSSVSDVEADVKRLPQTANGSGELQPGDELFLRDEHEEIVDSEWEDFEKLLR